MRAIATATVSATLLVFTACSDPECGDNAQKIGKTCFPLRHPDAAAGPSPAQASASTGQANSNEGGARVSGLDGGPETADGGTVASDNPMSVRVQEPGSTGSQSSTAACDGGLVCRSDAAVATPTCVAAPESCDHKDNDCDGVIDNGVTNACGGCTPIEPAHAVGVACSNGGRAECALPGVFACFGETTVCNAPPATPSTEVCDGKDNNCDGMVDEGVTNACGGCGELAHAKDSACSNGLLGECAASGVYACTAAKTATLCNAPVKVGSTELCDGKDNDCDGVIDNPVTWYRDCDSDGYGDPTGSIMACAQPNDASCTYTHSASPPDCDDTSAARHPGAKPLVNSGDPISPLRLDTYSGDTNCDGTAQRLSISFLNDEGSQFNDVDVVPCTATNACAGGKACYRMDGKPDGTIAGCGNTRVTFMIGGGSAACLSQTGTLRVICQ